MMLPFVMNFRFQAFGHKIIYFLKQRLEKCLSILQERGYQMSFFFPWCHSLYDGAFMDGLINVNERVFD